jgi:hypothetical protein
MRQLCVILVNGQEENIESFRSCESSLLNGYDDQIKVLIFQFVMAVVGGLAYWGVLVRKQYQLSRYDTRKLRNSNAPTLI